MLATALIVFREVFEIALIVSIVAAATAGVAGRFRWLSAGIGAGLAGALVIAGFAQEIAELASGVGQELVNACVLLAAVAMLGWHNVWMSRHGREMAQKIGRLGGEVLAGERPLYALGVVVAVATLREGAEVVLFLHGIAAAAAAPEAASMLLGGALGVAGGVIVGVALYTGLMRVPTRLLFTVTGWMILLLAAGMAGQAASYLVQADILPPLIQVVWDTSAILSEDNLVGQTLNVLVGYSARPSGIQLIFYLVTLITIGILMKLLGQPIAVASPTKNKDFPSMLGLAVLGLVLFGASDVSAQEPSNAELLPSLEVIAPKQIKYPTDETPDAVHGIAAVGNLVDDREGLLQLQGSGHVVGGEELFTSHVFTTNEALRKVPGVNIRDEEGFGIRPNIGIRGLNPTRSTKTLLMEDGLFLTYAPYGANESYFHPSMDRFSGVEVIKGADQLLYGPLTISGAVNYVTPNPPERPSGFVSATGGNRDYFNGQVFYGGWYKNFGGLVDWVHKRGDGARDNIEHEINDSGVKGVYQISPNSAFIVKASYFREDSTVTYSGITDAERNSFGIRYNPFKNDKFDTERYGTSLTNNWDVNDNINVRTSFYWSSFDRDWWRQSSTTTDSQCGGAFMAARRNGLSVNPDACASVQGRLREYESGGLDQKWTFESRLSEKVENELKLGYRVHTEEQKRRQINGVTPTARTGTLVENNERDAIAFALFAQDRIAVGPFSITPIVRYENIEFDRRNNLAVGGCAIPPCQGSFNISEIIPGISVGIAPTKGFNLFVGVHEGFAPPRVEDSIANTGGSIEVDAESSTNLEAGFRSELRKGIIVDATYFRNDFDNLVAVGSVAGGGQPLAQGEALFEGAELFARLNSNDLLRTDHNFYAQTAWTYLWKAEQVTPFIPIAVPPAPAPAPQNTAGNRQPYAPEHLLTTRVGVTKPGIFDAHLEAVYIGSQFADFLNLEKGADHPSGPASASARSGQFGKINSSLIFNLGTTYTIKPTKTDVFFSVKNLLDKEYIVDRTRGILPSAPRLFHIGLKQNI